MWRKMSFSWTFAAVAVATGMLLLAQAPPQGGDKAEDVAKTKDAGKGKGGKRKDVGKVKDGRKKTTDKAAPCGWISPPYPSVNGRPGSKGTPRPCGYRGG